MANSLKKTIAGKLSDNHLFKSILGKRTDDVGYHIFRQNYDLSLSKAEKKEIAHLWGQIIRSPLSWGYRFYGMAKAIHGFDARFLPSSYYMPYVFEALNPVEDLPILAHKGMQNLFFKGINQPLTIATCLSGGSLFDNDYNRIDRHRIPDLLSGRDFIIKPAHDSSMGRGVKMVHSDENVDFNQLFDSYNSNFIIQEVVRQSTFTSSLNPTSLNCMRITTLNLNGNISAENRIIKIGAKGQVVDNIGSGSGGMMIGVSPEGVLMDFGFRVNGEKTITKHDGMPFGGMTIPNFQKVLDFAMQCHSMIPAMGVVGWDIALDRNDDPLLVEANSYWPGITIEQVACGPVFADRTPEVIDFLTSKSRKQH